MRALVTGAASGIGKALSDELERTGWEVVRTDRAQGCVPLDVCDAAAFKRVVAEVGPLDLLVNNAGIAHIAHAHMLQDEDWNRVLDVNLHGVVNGIQAVYPGMVERRRGAILNVASLAGLLGFPGSAPYATTKFAVVGLSLSMRAEARRHGVKICAFCPGFLQTSIFDNATYRGVDRDRLQKGLRLPVLPVEGGVRAALAGLKKNRAVITYPFYASVITWPIRFNYALAELFHRAAMPALLGSRVDR